MPARELDTLVDYKNYLHSRVEHYNNLIDLMEFTDDPSCMLQYMEYNGHIEAYYDALFWLEMIGRPIPRD